MKRILTLICALLITSTAYGQAVTGVGIANTCGLAQSCGAMIAGIQTSAGSMIPAADDTYDLGSASLEWKDLYLDGTANIDVLSVSGASTLTGSVTTAGSYIASTTALGLISDTPDAADSKSVCIGGGGACNAAASYNRGGRAEFFGNEAAGTPGDVYMTGGGVAGADFTIAAEDDVILAYSTGAAIATFDGATKSTTLAGTLNGTAATGLGWVIASGANTACNTTCGISACAFGVETTTDADFVNCADATADVCICTGAVS